MNFMSAAAIVSILCILLVIPVAAEQDEQALLDEVQNLSVPVSPTPGTAVLGSRESMSEYQSFLDDNARALVMFSNTLLRIFGQKEMTWTVPNHPVQQKSDVTTAATAVPIVTPRSLLGSSSELKSIQTINGQSGHQSVTVTVPVGYWELWYMADPIVTGGQNSHSASGTNSAVFPSMVIRISDAASNEEIETVEPPGGLDSYLWSRAGDPRPWSMKFYRGGREITFDITTRHVKSYVIDVCVPK